MKFLACSSRTSSMRSLRAATMGVRVEAAQGEADVLLHLLLKEPGYLLDNRARCSLAGTRRPPGIPEASAHVFT